MDQFKDAAGLVEIIRDIIDTKLSQIDKTVTCLVQSVNEDGTLNVSILPDTQTVLQNIINESKYIFDQGDYAVLYMVHNRPSNSFVICKYDANQSDVDWSKSMSLVENSMNKLSIDTANAIQELSDRINNLQIASAPVTSVNARTGDVIGLAEFTDIPTFEVNDGVLTIHVPDGTLTV